MWVVRVSWGGCGVSVGWPWIDRDVDVHLVHCDCGAHVAWVLGGCGLVAGRTFCAASVSMVRMLYLFGSAAHGSMLHAPFMAHGCMHAKGPLNHAPQSLTYTPPFRGLSLAFGVRMRALTCGGLVLV